MVVLAEVDLDAVGLVDADFAAVGLAISDLAAFDLAEFDVAEFDLAAVDFADVLVVPFFASAGLVAVAVTIVLSLYPTV